MTDDVPEHLIAAVESVGVLPSNGNDQQDRWVAQAIAAAVLAALRPEDARLVPAWIEARAEIERLRAETKGRYVGGGQW